MTALPVIVMWLIAVLVSVPVVVFVVECLAALRPRKAEQLAEDPRARPQLAVLVPAHNEEQGLPATLASLQPQLLPGDRLLVVADNCTDATADVAREHGAELIERIDPDRRGKGYALAAGVEALRADPPAVVIVMDADCRPEPGALGILAAAALVADTPVQGVYLMRTGPEMGALYRLSAFAFLVKNLVRQRGLCALKQPALLQGTGMAFPWMAIDQARLQTPDLVEDLILGLDMIEAGHAVRFCQAAQVYSDHAHPGATLSQRARWEHGYLLAMIRRGPKLLLKGLMGRPPLLTVALDLGVPPLSLMLLVYLLAFTAVAGMGAWTGEWVPTVYLAIIAVWFIGTLAVVCRVFGRGTVGLGTLTMAPLYALWKLPIYLKFLITPQTEWVRTDRGTADTLGGDGAPVTPSTTAAHPDPSRST